MGLRPKKEVQPLRLGPDWTAQCGTVRLGTDRDRYDLSRHPESTKAKGFLRLMLTGYLEHP